MEEEFEIDLKELLFYILKHIIWPVLLAAVFAAGAFAYAKYTMKPTYGAYTRIYILNQTNTDVIGYNDIQSSRQLASDYEVLITGKNVTQRVTDQLNLPYTAADLTKMITVSVVDDTRILQIGVTSYDPQEAADIANCVREVAAEQIVEIMGVDAVNLVYEATVPTTPNGPATRKYIILAAVVGFMLVAAILTIRFLSDDTIKDEEDVSRYLQLNTIGVIPMSKDATTKKRKRGKK